MTARYMKLVALAPITALAVITAACGGPDADAAARPSSDAPQYQEVGQTPPAMVAGPERPDDPVADPDATDPAQPDDTRDPAQPADRPGPDATRAPDAAPTTPAPATPAPATDPSTPATDAILRETARTYERVGSLRAEFEQRMRNPLLGRETVSRGTLYQRQPDRFLMQFSDPDGDVIVSDGEFFWLYYPSVDSRQVIRAPRGPQGLDLHAQFIGDPVSRFSATSHGRENVRGRSAHVLTLVPRQAVGYRSLKVWIDTDDHLVRRFELTEDNGNVRHFELRDVVINPSLPDRLFQFTPPAGAQVIQRG